MPKNDLNLSLTCDFSSLTVSYLFPCQDEISDRRHETSPQIFVFFWGWKTSAKTESPSRWSGLKSWLWQQNVFSKDYITCREHQDCVVPQSFLLQSQSDVAYCLVHGWHHSSIQPAGVVFDETVGGHVALWHLQRRVDGLERHVEEERLEEIENMSGLILVLVDIDRSGGTKVEVELI